MNNQYITDTMALILRLEHRKLGETGKSIFGDVEKGNIELLVPAMVLAEVGYLSERNRVETSLEEFKIYRRKFPNVKVLSLNEEVICKAFLIKDIPELHDRIISATAYLYNLELITNDPIIRASKFVSSIW